MKAFHNSTLTSVTSLATTAPTLGDDGMPFNNGVWQDIFIPSGSKSSYLSKWSAYQAR